MTTITLKKQKSSFKKTNFQDEYELFEYLRDYLLVEKLHTMQDEEVSEPMNYKDSVTFLNSL